MHQVKVDPEAIKYCREKFAPADDPVFELVPPLFAEYATQVYTQMGSPALNSGNIWQVYCHIVQQLQDITKCREDENYLDVVEQWKVSDFLHNQDIEPTEASYPLIGGHELLGGMENPREDGSFYFGGVNNGQGLGMHSNISLRIII